MISYLDNIYIECWFTKNELYSHMDFWKVLFNVVKRILRAASPIALITEPRCSSAGQCHAPGDGSNQSIPVMACPLLFLVTFSWTGYTCWEASGIGYFSFHKNPRGKKGNPPPPLPSLLYGKHVVLRATTGILHAWSSADTPGRTVC